MFRFHLLPLGSFACFVIPFNSFRPTPNWLPLRHVLYVSNVARRIAFSSPKSSPNGGGSAFQSILSRLIVRYPHRSLFAQLPAINVLSSLLGLYVLTRYNPL